MNSALPLLLQRPVFDAVSAAVRFVLVVAMPAAWLRVIRKRSLADAGVVAVLLVVLMANVVGDQLDAFIRLDLQPAPFAQLVLSGVALAVALAMALAMGWLGSVGNRLVGTLSVEGLIARPIRLPLEVLTLLAAYRGLMQFEFSMRGYNFDVPTGLGALLISAYCMRGARLPLRAIWLWNVRAIGCLLAIVLLAALTSPNVYAFGHKAQRIKSWVLYFPYSMPYTLMPHYAVFGQVLLTRKLLAPQHSTLVALRPNHKVSLSSLTLF
jgi:hypothetical protein